MKVLVTAPPGTGKSTLIHHIIEQLQDQKKRCKGVLSMEKVDANGARVGFTALLSDGSSKEFMVKVKEGEEGEVSEGKSARPKVGSYQVQLDVMDDFVVPQLRRMREGGTPDDLIYIDEIGRAQAFSLEFLEVVDEILLCPSGDVLASIVFSDEVWARRFKSYDFVWLVEVTLDNRDHLPRILNAMYTHGHYLEQLPDERRHLLKSIFSWLLTARMFVSARKLFGGSVKYLVNGKVHEVSPHLFEVKGDTNDHVVTLPEGFSIQCSFACRDDIHQWLSAIFEKYNCDCPLYVGTGCFEGQAQVCSHIVAVLLNGN